MQQKNKVKIRLNSDETINLAQVLLPKNFPLTNGFEDTKLGNLSQFSVPKNNFIQIIHDHNHWITIYLAQLQRSPSSTFVILYKNQN